jgi:peptidoglycan/LPS O-acetylase OafA/YrhL
VLGLTAGEECGLPSGRHPWIQRLGDASYALYLIHFPLISLLTKVAFATGLPRLGIAGAAVTLIVEVAVCIAVSVAFHLWLEKPIIAFLRRKTLPFTEPNKPATAPPTGAA